MNLEFYYINDNHKIENKEDYKTIYVTLLGIHGIGKTQFVDRLINQNYTKFKEQAKVLHQTPLSIELEVKYQNNKFILHIQDTSGYARAEFFNKKYCKNSDIILLFYDSLNNTFPNYSYDNLDYYKRLAKDNAKEDTIFGLIRIKYDNYIKKEEEDFVPDEDVLEFADKNNFFFFHLGIFQKYETGIKELIKKIIDEYIKKINK